MISPIFFILFQIILVRGYSNEIVSANIAQFFPSKLRAEVLSSSSVRLTWDAATRTRRNVPKYKITVLEDYMRFDAPPKIVGAIFTEKTTLNITNLSPSTLYLFRVHSLTRESDPYEKGVQIDVKTWDKAEYNPSQLTANVLCPSKIRLTWNAVKMYQFQPPVYMIIIEPYTGKTYSTKKTSYDVANLKPSTTYTFKVYSVDYNGKYYEPGVATELQTSKKGGCGYIPPNA